jgi:hypothetical protein
MLTVSWHAVLCRAMLCPAVHVTLLQVVYTSGHLMRVNVVAVKHQQLLERPGSELHAIVSGVVSLVFVFCLCWEVQANWRVLC